MPNIRNCVLCNSNTNCAIECVVDDQAYARCRSCGLIYVNQPRQTAQLYKAYSGGILKATRRKLLLPFRRFHHARHFEESRSRAAAIFEFCMKHRKEYRPAGNFLDIGCNKGFLLAAAADHRWTVYGVELVPEQIIPFQNSYPQFRSNILFGRFQDARPQLVDLTFDMITAIDVIEHFEDVEDDLRGIYRMLAPGGIFVLQTPDAGCNQAKELGCDWGALKPLEHLHLFNRENLEILAKRVGFSGYTAVEPFEHADGNFTAILSR